MPFTKDNVRIVIFEADTPAGRTFDIGLLVFIVMSVILVMLDSVEQIHDRYGSIIYIAEWFFTIVFTVEYFIRLWCINNTRLYALSFYGIVDLICIIPTYLSLFIAGVQYLLIIRILRVLRVFRILRLVRFVGEAEVLSEALLASSRKIIVFILAVLSITVIFGCLMYLVEGVENGFANIPASIYWAIVTLTTVGYGDLVPVSAFGKALASVLMIMGYGVIAVPTGIVTLEMNEAHRRRANTRTCPECSAEGHSQEATYCWRCGSNLYPKRQEARALD